MDLKKREEFKVMFLTDLSVLFLQSSNICDIIKMHYFKCLTSKIRQEHTHQVSSTCIGVGDKEGSREKVLHTCYKRNLDAFLKSSSRQISVLQLGVTNH